MNIEVAIIDDDPIILFLHKRILKTTGFHQHPQAFDKAQKALDFFNSLQGPQNTVVAFLDINMPGMNGWDLLDIIHKQDFEFPIYVVMVTSSVDTEDKIKAKTYSKVIHFTEKPLSAEDIEVLKQKLP
ncbi:response regulator [Pedobacter cryophilus]|uniref:Response regulator n=1 Tax=Pedobacter cryophilus TaxID=2571271 RepID=A0A4U1BV40_9SPHI|nr:response regulator [Pedobacter cryophilus]TKB95984.1 response regulator [Pedobacter cryophilus]